LIVVVVVVNVTPVVVDVDIAAVPLLSAGAAVAAA
jgi:hypothetical protein